MQAIVRVFVDGKLQREPRLMDSEEISKLIADLVIEASDQPHMIEFEFPDAPLQDRFLRIGTDSRLMVDPIAIVLDDNAE